MSARLQLLIIRGAISELPENQRLEVEAVARDIREIVSSRGDYGAMGMALVGAEMAVEEERKEKGL